MSPEADQDRGTGAIFASISEPRLGPYLALCDEDRRRALALYQWNIDLSGAVYESLHVVEVILRNAIDTRLSTWNATQRSPASGAKHSRDWLLDPSRLLRRLAGKDIDKAVTNAARATRRAQLPRAHPDHNDVLAQMTFGAWRYLLPDRDPGRQLLWREALEGAFPNLQGEPSELTAKVHGVLRLRNRIAHLEPIVRPGYVASEFEAMRFILVSINPHLEEWMVSRQRITTVLHRRNPLMMN